MRDRGYKIYEVRKTLPHKLINEVDSELSTSAHSTQFTAEEHKQAVDGLLDEGDTENAFAERATMDCEVRSGTDPKDSGSVRRKRAQPSMDQSAGAAAADGAPWASSEQGAPEIRGPHQTIE